MMEFDGYNDHQLKELAATKALFKYRRESMPLMYGDYRTLYADDDVYVFLRHYMGEWVVVALNVRAEAREVEVAMPEFIVADAVKVALSNEGAEAKLAEGKLSINVPKYGYVIIAQ
jgi:glycosidase